MAMVTVLVIIAVGLAVGLLSGLVGIGGGVLMVPFLYFFYDRPDLFGVIVDPEARVVLAHGTSLLVMVPTSVRGALAYHKSNLVEWRAVWPIGAASILSALGGAQLAAILPPELLKTAFGALLIFSGLRMVWPRKAQPESLPPTEPRLSLPRTIMTGLLVGLMSSLLGIGGGTVAIPLLIYLVRLDIKQVAATSIGIIGLTATAGTVGYVVSGMNATGLPPMSLGYVHVSAAIALFIGAIISVRWGTALNQRMKPRSLSLLFGVLFLVLGFRLAGANLLALLGDAGAAAGLAAAGVSSWGAR
jgi:uncharacterized protein